MPTSVLAARLAWQQSVLPAAARTLHADWLLSPFNVLPLAPGVPGGTRTAVIVSSIAPFAPGRWTSQTRYGAVRDGALRRMTLASMRMADRVAFVGETAYSLVDRDVDPGKVSILPPARPSEAALEAAARLRVPDAIPRPFFACVGDLYRYAGVEDAVLALATLRRRGFEAHLVVCGRQMDRAYASRLRSLVSDRAPGSVTFLDHASQAMELALMREARATLICSRVGDSTHVPLAAMAVGSPVVVADTPITVDVCSDAVSYYAPTEYGDLAASLEDLMWREHERALLRQRGHARARELDPANAARALAQMIDLA